MALVCSHGLVVGYKVVGPNSHGLDMGQTHGVTFGGPSLCTGTGGAVVVEACLNELIMSFTACSGDVHSSANRSDV